VQYAVNAGCMAFFVEKRHAAFFVRRGNFHLTQAFFDDLNTLMYSSPLLHTFGVNGKVSGSVGAAGEMNDVAAVLHGAEGCAFHYRNSARRRHQPFYRLFSSGLTDREVICGGEKKLEQTVRQVWDRERPKLVFIIPTPVSDILNEDIQSVTCRLRAEGIPVVGIQSECFSHRDKSYTRRRVRELARNKISGDNKLEMELKGCGFTELLCALVNQVMEPQKKLSRTVNIETVGWGSEGKQVLREIDDFLSLCNIKVHTWIPSAPVERLVTAPAAQLNLVKRVRWARMMKERFGTDYLHISTAGRYTGLDGICTFYRDIGEKLGIAEEMEPLILQAREKVLTHTMTARDKLSRYRCALVCRNIQNAPFRIKLFAKDFSLQLGGVYLIVTPDMERDIGLTPQLKEQLLSRVEDSISLYAPGTPVFLNPSIEQLRTGFSQVDAVVGTDDFTLEGLGAPIIPAMSETTGLSFPSYERNVARLLERLSHRSIHDEMILNHIAFDTNHLPLCEGDSALAAREMWKRMWLYRKEGEQ